MSVSPQPKYCADWAQALGSGNPQVLKTRLQWDGLDLQNLDPFIFEIEDESGVGAMGDPEKTVGARTAAFAQIVEAVRFSADRLHCRPVRAERAAPGLCRSFSDLWQAPVERAETEVRRSMAALPAARIEDSAYADLAAQLMARFRFVADQALWDMFHREAGTGALVLERLAPSQGGPESHRSDPLSRFIERRRADGLASVLAEFPVLGQLLGEVYSSWLDCSRELLSRVHRDRDEITATFHIPAQARLSSVGWGKSDPHSGGRTVAVLGFVDGRRSWKIVYKPRDMRIDAAYQRALDDLNDKGSLPPLKTLKVLSRAGYGYMEFVRRKPARRREELDRFYYNAGRLLAVLHVLGCTDCHSENLVAAGDQLVLVDGETLLQPVPRNDVRAAPLPGVVEASRLGSIFEESVVRTEALPAWSFAGLRRQALDTSALGAERGVASPPTVGEAPSSGHGGNIARGNDAPPVPDSSLPVQPGRSNPLVRHIDALSAGFRDQGIVLMDRRRAWLRPGGVLGGFAGLPRRMVVRATRIYFAVQLQQIRPEALRSAFAQRMKLEQLARLYLVSDSRPRNWPLFGSELRQMQRLDIPYFVHRTDGTEMAIGRGRPAIAGFFRSSGLQDCRRRLKALNASETDQQLQIIRGAIEAKRLRAHSVGTVERPPQIAPGSPLSRVLRVGQAQGIAQMLLDIAFDDGIGWLGLDLAEDGSRFQFRPLRMSLYSGSIGIAAFFACLARSAAPLGGPEVESLGRLVTEIFRALAGLVDSKRDDSVQRWWRAQPPGLGGAAGVLLGLLAIDELGAAPAGFPSGRDLAARLVDGLEETSVGECPHLDLIRGQSGLIGPLLRLGTARSARFAEAIGDALLLRQTSSGAWPIEGPGGAPSTLGFSNGPSGLTAALAALHRDSGIARFGEAARRSLLLERRWLRRGRGTGARGGGLHNSWCHGRAGTILGRLCLAATDFWSPAARRDVEILAGALSPGGAGPDQICCGRLGCIAVLRLASDELGDQAWRGLSDRLESSVFGDQPAGFANLRFHDERQPTRHQLGFLNGLSGAGLVLLDDQHSRRVVRTLLSGGLMRGGSAPAVPGDVPPFAAGPGAN
ncbi:MAG TPA: type 2 lanthipeptide synthetase LanM [Allosphingosinicella sp.]|nr:type 2 lanthipeptide synthetase LanM [Allosphingosinicella sp.]